MQLSPFDRPVDERDWETAAEGSVRFAVVGLGGFTRRFALPAIAECEHAEATVAASGSAEKAERVAGEHGLAAGVTYEALLDGRAADEYDAVYVATPNGTHLEHGAAAAGRGKHVLVEKPMEATAERATAMVDACEDAGVRLMVAYRMQTDPILRRTRELLRAGVVGDVLQAAGTCAAPFVSSDGEHGWRTDPDLAGGGAMYDIGVYPLNTIRFLLDDDPRSVAGTVVRDDAFLGGMDLHASFVLGFPGDVTATCRTSYDAELEGRVSVLGTDGRVVVDPAFWTGVPKTVRVVRGDEEVEVTGGGGEVTEEFDYFANAILADAGIEPDGADGLVDMQVLEAVYESDGTGRRVEL